VTDLLALAQSVADKTADRISALWTEKLATLRDQWQSDLGKLRDDLTVQGLIQGENCGLDCPLRKRVVATVKGATVLVVDDYEDVRKALVRILEVAGMTVFGAANSVTAMEILANSNEIDVVVADAIMPKNGHTLLEYVRREYPTVEVIMISGFEGGAAKARELGAFCFLAKPFSAEQAVMFIERAVELRRLKMANFGRYDTTKEQP
jgi:two-component system response regulator (stage 0 sporulation protein F)